MAERSPMGIWLVARSDIESQPVYVLDDGADSDSDTDEDAETRTGDEIARWASALGTRLLADGLAKSSIDLSTEPTLLDGITVNPYRAGAFVGAPLLDDERKVTGLLCGVDPDPQRVGHPDKLPLVQELAALLSWVLALEIESDRAKLAAVAAMEHGQRDGLTGVLNRRGWDLALEREAHRCATLDQGASVIIIDLDDLKGMNDRYGHAYGDDQIRALAQCITSVARGNDIVARLGGDEFGVLAPGSSPGTADELGERLRAEFRRRNIAATLGGAECPPQGNLSETWRRADMEMYAAKRLDPARLRREDTNGTRTEPVGLGELVGSAVHLATTPCRVARSVWRTVRPR
jgi:diguanylate cyclase (GGDEF)-like protein